MFASLLPGLRELRAPLAAGYIWLVFVYFVVGAPTEVKAAPGPLQQLLTVLPPMGTVATGIAVGFVAYLIGSLSQDLFDQVLPRAHERLSRRLTPDDPAAQKIECQLARARQEAKVLEDIQKTDSDEQWAIPARAAELGRERRPVKERIRVELDALLSMLDDLRAAGASEEEKPEARRPMVEAEERLRTAIVPPLIGVMTYLTITESLVWVLGVMFSAAVFWQAVTRRAEAHRLADQYYQGQSIEETQTELKKVSRELADSDRGIDARSLRVALEDVSHRLRARGTTQ
jgi:hypothetical protein